MAHAQKPDLFFQRNGRVLLNRRGCQFSRLLAVEECGSADSNRIDRVPTYNAKLLATHSIRIFPLHFPARASPCAIRLPSELQIFKTDDRKNERHTEMTTHPDYTDILLHNGHFLSHIFKVEASTTEFHFHHNLRLLFDFDTLHPSKNTVTTRNLAFFSYWYRKKRLQMHF